MAIIYIDLTKYRPKYLKNPVRPARLVWIFKNKYDDGHSSIHFIQNLMLNLIIL
jgi:hypothetical protein